jgi:hypothetical protein
LFFENTTSSGSLKISKSVMDALVVENSSFRNLELFEMEKTGGIKIGSSTKITGSANLSLQSGPRVEICDSEVSSLCVSATKCDVLSLGNITGDSLTVRGLPSVAGRTLISE